MSECVACKCVAAGECAGVCVAGIQDCHRKFQVIPINSHWEVEDVVLHGSSQGYIRGLPGLRGLPWTVHGNPSQHWCQLVSMYLMITVIRI